MKNYSWFASITLLLVLVMSACTPQAASTPAQSASADGLIVTVSILPQQYFVERIGGERVKVNVMVAPGDSPHNYEPKPEQMTALSQSAAYFSIGVDFEGAWLDKIAAANPNMLMVDTIADVERLPMAAHSHEGEEDHDEDEEHEEDGLDPHVWTSPELVKIMSQSIYAALAQLDPDHQAEYQKNLDQFVQEIDTLEAEIRQNLAGLEGKKFFVFHPAWGYFANDFGLEQIPIETGGTEPSAKELAALIDEARHEGVRVIFVQPEMSTKAAETIAAEIGGSVVPISPLAYDWMSNLSLVAEAFRDVLGQQGN
jgi:zinc transport system substrate-binding protein